MNLQLVVRAEVEADIAAAAAWYRQQSPTASDQFVEAARDLLLRIAQNPFQYQVAFGRYRKAIVRPFPYLLVYGTTETEIVVVACTHGRRDPERWQERIRE
jgi:plasmid stabilization system protein ParE